MLYNTKNIKSKIHPKWKNAWKWFSIQAFILSGAIQTTYLNLPEDWKALIPPSLVGKITIIVAILGVIGRLFTQPSEEK